MDRYWSIFLLVLGGVLVACSSNDPLTGEDDFTGNEVTYSLVSGSDFNVSGVVVLRERKDGYTTIDIDLNGMAGTTGLTFPVHLHYGDVGTGNASIAALLQPVSGSTWKSSTLIKNLADESIVTFTDLKEMDACIKIHFAATGPEKDIILSAGNIGMASAREASGRFEIATCKSE